MPGIAVISLLFSSTLICPRTSPFSRPHALTMWIALLAVFLWLLPLSALPSMATISPLIYFRSPSVHA